MYAAYSYEIWATQEKSSEFLRPYDCNFFNASTTWNEKQIKIVNNSFSPCLGLKKIQSWYLSSTALFSIQQFTADIITNLE